MKFLLLPLVPLLIAGHSPAQEAGFRPLFNGKDLTGWTGEGYAVEDGAITATPQAKNLVTTETFYTYVLDFDFLLTAGAPDPGRQRSEVQGPAAHPVPWLYL
jgi:hypothetical protein